MKHETHQSTPIDPSMATVLLSSQPNDRLKIPLEEELDIIVVSKSRR
jgi:hypothetical protein